jgi:hypothetical protein
LTRVAPERKNKKALMLRRSVTAQCLLLCVFGSALLCQQNSSVPAVHGGTEFPVILQQGIVAGKSLAGTRVRAKLQVATLVDGTVIPRNAILAGEVIESTPKTAADPSRLAIRMDSVQWKNGSAAIKVYLTPWYYLTTAETGQSLQYGPPQSPNRTWNGQGAYPNPNSASYKPFPGGDSDADKNSVPDAAAVKTSDHRALMKDTESMRSDDGTLALVSKRITIKLDKLTTYVFAASDLLPNK